MRSNTGRMSSHLFDGKQTGLTDARGPTGLVLADLFTVHLPGDCVAESRAKWERGLGTLQLDFLSRLPIPK